jgi:hypothetical protein
VKVRGVVIFLLVACQASTPKREEVPNELRYDEVPLPVEHKPAAVARREFDPDKASVLGEVKEPIDIEPKPGYRDERPPAGHRCEHLWDPKQEGADWGDVGLPNLTFRPDGTFRGNNTGMWYRGLWDLGDGKFVLRGNEGATHGSYGDTEVNEGSAAIREYSGVEVEQKTGRVVIHHDKGIWDCKPLTMKHRTVRFSAIEVEVAGEPLRRGDAIRVGHWMGLGECVKEWLVLDPAKRLARDLAVEVEVKVRGRKLTGAKVVDDGGTGQTTCFEKRIGQAENYDRDLGDFRAKIKFRT